MIKKLILFSLAISFFNSLSAQIFTQDFSASTTTAIYQSSVPNSGQFTSISSNSGTPSTINNGALRFEKTAISSSFFYRNSNPPLPSNPTFIQFKFDFEVTNNDPNHPDNRREIPFYFGPNFSAVGTSINDVYCRFGLGISATSGNFFLKILDNGSTTSSDFSGKQTITFIANNTGNTQTYEAPDSSTESIANDTWEIWVGTTKIFNDVAVRNPDMPLGGFKLQNNSFLPLATLDFDNFEYKDFLNDFAPTPTTQSLVHPHIWVSNDDKQQILDNITNHAWATSLFNQLMNRQTGVKNSHAANPASILNQIPAIPGNRVEHRARLNTAAESAMLYYLTGDEGFAQLSADILNHYVKILSVQNPLTFEFYSDNFNHLIPPRELFPRVAITYDFIQPFLKKSGTTVYNLSGGSRLPFDFTVSQRAFEVMADNVIKVGGNNSNHPVLELPGALYSVMCMEDDAIRASFFDKLLNGAANSKQPGINWMIDRFADTEDGSIWPESAGYSKFTQAIFIQMMNVVDRYQPDLNIVDDNLDIINGIFIYENQKYPNGAVMAYGDIGREFTDHDFIFRNVIAIADRKGLTTLKDRAATTLQKLYSEQGGYNPVIENQRLEWNNPLQLFWGVNIDASVSNAGEPNYSTVTANHAGIIMQRNYVETNNEDYGLMYYTGGGTYVHGHAGGIDMELYGAGYVIGPDYGADSFGSDIHEEYAVSYAAHNTIIVNGTSKRGVPNSGTWENITDPVVLEAAEPKAYANPVASSFSFSTQFLDDNINNLDQQRTNSIIRTSATSGYYVDIFRSVSNATNNFHDYLFHGLGDVMQIKSGGNLLSLTNTPSRYPIEAGAPRNQPGWQYFTNSKTSTLTSAAISARFDLQATNDYLHVNVPGSIDREYSSATAPPTKEVKNGYSNKDTQMFIMRKYGEAWNEPFVAIYEPSGNEESTVKSSSNIYLGDKVVGVKVESEVSGELITDVIISNDTGTGDVNLPNLDIAFNGRFAVVRTKVKNNTTLVSLYIGSGQNLSFNGETINADGEGKAYKELTLDFAYTFPVESNNFTIETIGETCIGKENGIISIKAKLDRDYTVTLNGNATNFTSTTTLENLSPGTYDFCITILGDSFKQCYQAIIEGGTSLTGKINIEKQKAVISIEDGTAPYTVLRNGQTVLETYQSNFSVDVTHDDDIQIKTKSSCQGKLVKRINLLENIKAYPNPSNGLFDIFIPSDLESIHLEVYNIQSQIISSKVYPVHSGVISLNISENPNGIYFVKVNLEQPVFVKLIKK